MRIMLNDTFLIEREEAVAELLKGEIEIPDQFKEKANTGIILALPEGETQIRVGDKVVFSKHAAEDVKIDGEELVRINRKGIFWIDRYEADDLARTI